MSSTKDTLKAFTVILRASEAIEAVIKRDVAQYGLNMTEFAVLELLYHKGDQPTQVIGQKILISSGSITYVVDKLVKKKYVVRKGCKEDRRVTFAHLTEEGISLMDEIFPKHEEKIAELFDQLDASEVKETIQLMKKIGYRAKSI
ncbi:MAG: MarR family winged helix-turn-helix transcriptional regulator [Bacillus sp. (in: firmicutes)]